MTELHSIPLKVITKFVYDATVTAATHLQQRHTCTVVIDVLLILYNEEKLVQASSQLSIS